MNIGKVKKDVVKWCEFHKNPTPNMDECCTEHALMPELKNLETYACYDYESKPNKGTNKGNKIVYVESTMKLATTKLQKVETKDAEEGEFLF